jgi:phage recombination protein Bet
MDNEQTTVDVATRPAGVLVVANDAQDFTDAQLDAFGISKASRGEQMVFLHTIQRTGLDPAARQIYMIGRWSSRDQRDKYTIQTGIDGYRLIAARTGIHVGTDDSAFAYNDHGQVVKATVTVWKLVHGTRCGFTASAYWAEYVQMDKNGNPNQMWQRMGHTMIAKCAEALALRKAFPQDLAGIYTTEEMGQSDNDHVVVRQVQPKPAATAREDTTDAEIVDVLPAAALASEIAASAAKCGKVEELLGIYAEAKARGLLAVSADAAVTKAQAAVAGVTGAITLGSWITACGKYARNNGGMSIQDAVNADAPIPATA